MFLVGCTRQGMPKNKNKNHMDLEAKVDGSEVGGGLHWTPKHIGLFVYLVMCL